MVRVFSIQRRYTIRPLAPSLPPAACSKCATNKPQRFYPMAPCWSQEVMGITAGVLATSLQRRYTIHPLVSGLSPAACSKDDPPTQQHYYLMAPCWLRVVVATPVQRSYTIRPLAPSLPLAACSKCATYTPQRFYPMAMCWSQGASIALAHTIQRRYTIRPLVYGLLPAA